MPGRECVDETKAVGPVELCKLIWQFQALGWRRCVVSIALLKATDELW